MNAGPSVAARSAREAPADGAIRLPVAALTTSGFDAASAISLDPRQRVWLVTGDAGEIVLRSADRNAQSEWLASVLADLSDRFPVPCPRRIFDGKHWVDHGTQRWEAFSFLPGEAIGFHAVPTLEMVGRFLARFHIESLSVGTSHGPAPRGTPLPRLDDFIDRGGAALTMGSRSGAERLDQLLVRLGNDLRDLNYEALPRCVAHGDATTFNILAVHGAPVPSGLIDFELSDIEAAVADIAFCLWRSGRPSQAVRELDYGRVEALIAGYHALRPLSSSEAAAIPICLVGRGLQMLVKRTRLGVADVSWIVSELEWIVAHEPDLVRAVVRSVG